MADAGLRQRLIPDSEAPSDWDSDLPYGGKVYLARKKKPDPTYVKVIEAVVLISTLSFALYAYYYFDHLHFNVTYAYAWLGYPSANHQIGQRYLHGKGVEKHIGKAMEHFKEAHMLIQHAASKGVKEAHQVLNEVCSRGGCKN